MTKAELVAAIAQKSGLTRTQAKDGLDAFIDCVSATVKGGQDVRIVGFGSFVPVERPAGLARNPRTGEKVQREASRTVRFRPGESLKGTVE
jgi:DNA-binding protein HU-beta